MEHEKLLRTPTSRRVTFSENSSPSIQNELANQLPQIFHCHVDSPDVLSTHFPTKSPCKLGKDGNKKSLLKITKQRVFGEILYQKNSNQSAVRTPITKQKGFTAIVSPPSTDINDLKRFGMIQQSTMPLIYDAKLQLESPDIFSKHFQGTCSSNTSPHQALFDTTPLKEYKDDIDIISPLASLSLYSNDNDISTEAMKKFPIQQMNSQNLIPKPNSKTRLRERLELAILEDQQSPIEYKRINSEVHVVSPAPPPAEEKPRFTRRSNCYKQ